MDNLLAYTGLIWLGAFLAGFLGDLTGLGGGVVIVPMLVLLFHVDLRYAIGASLVSVIATSSGAAAAYVKEGYSNVRVGMLLEIATTIGALAGAYLALIVAPNAIAVVFGVVLLISAYLSSRPRVEENIADKPDRLAVRLRLDGNYPTSDGLQSYHVHQVPVGFGLMFGAGVLSGLLGIGSGALKVFAHRSGHALAVQGVHHHEQFHDRRDGGGQRRRLSQPWLHRTRIGIAGYDRRTARLPAGSESAGEHEHVKTLRIVFALVITALAIEMIYKGLVGGI